MKKLHSHRNIFFRKKLQHPFQSAVIFLLIILTLPLAGCAQDETDLSAVSIQKESDNKELEVWVFFDENTPCSYYVDLWDELGAEMGFEITLRTYSTEQIKDKLKISGCARIMV